MGDRSVIVITTRADHGDTVSLYGHWAGDTNLSAVQHVLGRAGARVGDISYLTAQVFHEFAVELGGYTGDTGFGIWAGDCSTAGDSNNPTVWLDADTGDYTYDEKLFNRDNEEI